MNRPGPRELGIPVRAARNGTLISGRDACGKPCVYAVIQHQSEQAALLLLQIDPDTGETRSFHAPPGTASGVLHWSERWQRLFAYVSRGEKGVGRLLEFEPAAAEFHDLGRVHPDRPCLPTSMDEAPDGTLYLGSYGKGCILCSYRPDTRQFVDHGPMDENEFYFYVQCGSDGTVAGLVKVSRPHVVVLNPETGEHSCVGPVADTDAGRGRVELVKASDGRLYIDSHEGVFRLDGAALVPVAERPASAPPPALPDGSTFRFLDGRSDNVWLTRYRTIEIKRPGGRRRVIEIDYECGGTSIYIVRAGNDGKLYGSSILPLHFFSYDPATEAMVHHGACTTASGEVYSMDAMGDKVYFCSYTHAILSEFDTTRPFSWGGPVPGRPGEFKKGRSGENLSYTYDENDNPRQLGRMDNVAYRPRDMVAGPAGKVWVVSIPDYGMWGGTLSWYDPATGVFGGAHRHILRDCSPISITHMSEEDLLAIGFSIYGGSGTTPRVDRAGLALWNPREDKEVWKGDLGLRIVGIMDVQAAGDGLLYAIVHQQPETELKAELMLLDLPNERIVSRVDLTQVLGWPLEVSFQTDERYLYGATNQGIYRVELGTTDVEVLWRDEQDGPGPMIGAGALLDGVYYFASGPRLRALPVT